MLIKHSFVWDSISFEENRYIIHINSFLKLIVNLKGSVKGLNNLKESGFFERITEKMALSIYADERGNVSEFHPSTIRLNDRIFKGIIYYSFTQLVKNKWRVLNKKHFGLEIHDYYFSLSFASQCRMFETELNRTEYLKWLVKFHSPEYKLVVVKEANLNIHEDAFLFTKKKSNGGVLIIWENVNDKRATYTFKCNQNSYNTTIDMICSFLGDSTINKRSNVKAIFSISEKHNHSDINTFEREITADFNLL